MKKITLWLSMLLMPFAAHGQTAVIPVYACTLPGVQAQTSGLKSTNYLQGVIPLCLVKVYLTGTTTIATTSPQSPFTANTNGSIPPIYAATGQAYDVVLSGGISPNTYSSPVTLTGLTAGGGGPGSSGFPITLGSTSIAANSTTTSIAGLTVDGVTPTVMARVDPTSSIQTQLNSKGAGTVTAISVATVNGFQGTSSGGATPALTLNVDSTHVLPVNTGVSTSFLNQTGGYSTPTGIGVTAIGVTSANGISGTSSGGTTPNLTFTLGAITPSSVNGITLSNAGPATQYLDKTGSYSTPAGSASVTSIGVTTANGVSGTSSGGTTPLLTISLGAITPSFVNSVAITSTGSAAQLLDAAGIYRAISSSDIPNNAANTTGTAANITATSNSTLTTLSSLALPYSQVSGTPAALTAHILTVPVVCPAMSGSSTAYTCSTNPSFTPGADDQIYLIPDVSNSGTNPTLSVNGQTAGTILNGVGGFIGVNGIYAAGRAVYLLKYNSGNWEIQTTPLGYPNLQAIYQLTHDVLAGPGSGAQSATVVGINGTNLSTLATGLLKNTTGSGTPSIASATDINTTLGYTPYSAANPSGFITAASLSPYAQLSGATFTGSVTAANVTDSSLTVGNCVQASTAGILTTAAGPCGVTSGTLTTTGSPASGQITEFSGASSVTTATAAHIVAAIGSTPVANATLATTATTATTVPASGVTGTTLASGVTASSLTSAAGGTFGTGAYATAYVLPTATSSTLGGVKPDNVSILNAAGVLTATLTSIGADASGAAATAQSNAETYAQNASNINTGVIGVSYLPTGIPIGSVGSAGLSGTSPISIAATGAISCPTCNTSSATVSSVTFTGDGTVDSSTPSTAVTTSGTVTATLKNQAANTVFGNFTGSSAAPTFTAAPTFSMANLTGMTSGQVTTALTYTPVAPTVTTLSYLTTAAGGVFGTAAFTASTAYDASGAASTAQSNAETYAANASNLSSGTVALARMAQSNTSISGYLSSTDWNTFNGKQSSLGFTPYNATNPAGYITSSVTTLPSLSLPYSQVSGTPSAYVLPTATSTVLGGVKPDGTSILNTAGAISATAASVGADASGAAAARAAVGNCSAGQYGTATTTSGLTCAQVAYSQVSGTPSIPTVGTWGALNYPTWASGTPFVKMTAAGTFALDTNTYGTFTLPSLTSGSVLFSNGTTIAEDNANFFWDATNHRLGIGTTAPATPLEVVKSISGTEPVLLTLRTNTGNSYGMQLGINSSGYGYLQSQDFGVSYINTPLAIQPNGGNVGIGTTSPDYKLIVNGIIAPTTNTGGGLGDSGRYWGRSYIAGLDLGEATIINATSISSDTSTDLSLYSGAGHVVKLGSNGTQGQMVINNGNVSIGDSAAAAMFNVGTANQFQVTSTGVSSAGAGSTDLNGSGVPEAHCLADGTGCPSTTAAISSMTAGQVPIAASGTTITSSKALAGSGAGIVTGPTTSVSGHAASFSGTGGQIQDSGAPISWFGSSNANIGGNLSPSFTGTAATAVGYDAMTSLTTGGDSVAIGASALRSSTTGLTQVAIGNIAMYNSTTGNYNTAVGDSTLYHSTTGSSNTAIGQGALGNLTTASNNVGVGYGAGIDPVLGTFTTLSNSTFLGYGATSTTNALTNMTVIGYNAQGSASNQVVIGNSSVTDVYLGSVSGLANIHAANLFTLPSLTSGSVLFSNGSTIAQDNSNFFWDATNHWLGIGKTSPQQALDVYSTTNYQGILVRGNSCPDISFVQDAGTTPTWKAGISCNHGTSFSISEGSGPTDRLVIATGGNVGIGTLSPAALLSVGSSSQFQVSSTGVSSAGAGSTDLNGSGVPEAHCLADGTGCPAIPAIACGTTGAFVYYNGTSYVCSTDVVHPTGGGIASPTFNPTATQTTVSCSTSGSVVFSEPFSGTSYKELMLYSNACLGTASYTYPIAFTNTPTLDVTGGGLVLTTSLTTTAITVTGTDGIGNATLIGY